MTDPARTTKLTRQELMRVNDEFQSERDAAKGDAMRAFDERNIALNAADALRAQVAALQAELAAAQAKLAVPVLKDVQDMAESLWLLDIDEAADMLTALARDNAALRTQAEALERERDVWYCGLCCKDMPWTGSGRCADCGTKLAEKL